MACAPEEDRMPREMLTVDADGHVLEPADTWQRYIDPKFKDLAGQMFRRSGVGSEARLADADF
jgi:hypothetical protein